MKVAGLLVLAGWALLVTAATLVYEPAGVAMAGVGCLYLARAMV